MNGLLGREDWDAAIKMPIGVVPAGLFYLFMLLLFLAGIVFLNDIWTMVDKLD